MLRTRRVGVVVVVVDRVIMPKTRKSLKAC